MAEIEMADRTSIEVGVGDELVIRLPENGTTGYVWSVKDTGAPLELADDRVTPQTHAIGAASQRVLTLRAVAAGRASVVLELAREWENAPAEERRYSVTVK